MRCGGVCGADDDVARSGELCCLVRHSVVSFLLCNAIFLLHHDK